MKLYEEILQVAKKYCEKKNIKIEQFSEWSSLIINNYTSIVHAVLKFNYR